MAKGHPSVCAPYRGRVSSPVIAILVAAGIHLLAVVSPGPNFLVISRTVGPPKSAAQWVTIGVTVAAFLLIGSGFLGASAVFTRSERLYDGLRLAGATYLAYLGLRALWGVWRSRGIAVHDVTPAGPAPTRSASFRLGLLTIASNAKAYVYFVVFFTSVVPPDLPLAARFTLVIVMPSITLAWYSFISWAFSGNVVRGWYSRLRIPVELVFGGLLLVIGIEVALSI